MSRTKSTNLKTTRVLTRSLARSLAVPVLSTAVLLSCGKSSPNLANQPEGLSGTNTTAHIPSRNLPKVDVLFVIDNAEAMKAHQDNLSKNIDSFVDVFQKSASSLDFHIGVTSLFDRTRWVKGADGCDYDDGQLRYLKHLVDDPNHPGQKVDQEIAGRNYVTRDDDIVPILKETLKLGEQPFHKCGYNKEEKFGPVEASFRPEMMNGPNKGFYRADAELAVIFVSDADDETPDISASDMAQFLLAAKNNNRQMLSVFAVTTARDAGDTSCPRDNDGPPVKIHDLIDSIQGQYLNLCDPDFGQQLASFAQLIKQKAMSHSVHIDGIPDLDSVVVHYGDMLVPPGPNGWTYDPESHTIQISGTLDTTGATGTDVSVDYTLVKINDWKNPQRIHVVGH